MDWVRTGLALRALRLRRRWTQAQLASAARVSRSLVGAVERGGGDRVTGEKLAALAASLGARLRVQVLWHGEDLDRLLDRRHAALVDAMVRYLESLGWQAHPEVTFQRGSERGSVDILAVHSASAALLVVEVKSVVPDIQATLAALDRKARLAPRIAVERALRFVTVSRLLVLPENATTRRRVQLAAATFAAAYPARNVRVRRWLRAPSAPLAGMLFLSDGTQPSSRKASGGAPEGSTHEAGSPSSPMVVLRSN